MNGATGGKNENLDIDTEDSLATVACWPREWAPLPGWVRDEVLDGPADLLFYDWYLWKLAQHAENMKAVWALFDSHRDVFGGKGPLHALLELLFRAKLETSLAEWRLQDDRRSIAEGVREHVDALFKLMKRLGHGCNSDMYPPGVTDAIDAATEQVAQERAGQALHAALAEAFASMDEADIPVDTKMFTAELDRHVHAAVELEMTDLRLTLNVLADATEKWASACGWDRSDVIWRVGSKLHEWFGSDHFAAAATLVTAILEEEISVGSVEKIMKRRRALIAQDVNSEKAKIFARIRR